MQAGDTVTSHFRCVPGKPCAGYKATVTSYAKDPFFQGGARVSIKADGRRDADLSVDWVVDVCPMNSVTKSRKA